MLTGEATSQNILYFTVSKADPHKSVNEDKASTERFNKMLSEAKTPEERVKLAMMIAECGFKNTGQIILVQKHDSRALVFESLAGGKVPTEPWKMTLKSHPGKAIVRIDAENGQDGEQLFLGDASNAQTVKFDGKESSFIHSMDMN